MEAWLVTLVFGILLVMCTTTIIKSNQTMREQEDELKEHMLARAKMFDECQQAKKELREIQDKLKNYEDIKNIAKENELWEIELQDLQETLENKKASIVLEGIKDILGGK